MKFFAQVIVVALISWLLQSFFPWWSMAIGAFVVGVIFRQSGFMSFLAGLIAVGLLWWVMAYINSGDSDLAVRVAAILPTKTVGILLVFTALVGGLVGGIASMSGGLITNKKKARY
jgi:hypothetical protein